MPHTTARDGVRIHYDHYGFKRNPPLLLLQGLGADSRGWFLQTVVLARHFNCILVDNRGVGRSDKPDGPYALEDMAADAIAVLDHAGIETAHVLGASMGGVLAEILGVNYRERVRSLVLSCTACHHHAWRRELLEEWASVAQEQGMRAFASANMRWLVGPRSLRRFWPAFGALTPVAISAPTHSFVAQVRAILDMDDSMRDLLPTIDVPTLVITGSQDVLTPQGDAEELAELIPGAELAIVQGAAHGLMVEAFLSFNRIVGDFLARAETDWCVATSLSDVSLHDSRR